jgi:asparagine synthase (glutamine-hydrolysing)
MCGIAGVIGNQDRETIERMTSTIAHRGPDGSGIIRFSVHDGEELSFGHRRLAIIDLSPTGSQPMSSNCRHCCPITSHDRDRIWMVFNGEIYNFRDLRADLESVGHKFSGTSDTEVLIHLYAEHGVEFLKLLNGIFALAIYDGRANPAPGLEQGDVLIARDHFGVKPLYYSQQANRFSFCSEIKGLLPALRQRSLNPEAIACHLSLLYAPAPMTGINEVKKLPPGSMAVVRKSRILFIKKFYEIPFDRKIVYSEPKSTALIVKQAFMQAVRRQMVADVPVGAFLSGGVDSTAIVAAMRQITEGPLICFTIHDDEGMNAKNSDLEYARFAASEIGTELVEVDVRAEDFSHLSDLVFQLDEPIADPSSISTALISRSARQQGIKVLLAGTGGDDVFAGYPRHLASHWLDFEDKVPVPIRKLFRIGAEKIGITDPGSVFWSDLNRKMWRILSEVDQPVGDRIAALMISCPPPQMCRLLNPDFAALARTSALRQLSASISGSRATHSNLNRMLFCELNHFLADHNLSYFDKMSMAHGVEVRVPFLDKDLVDLSAQISPDLKLHGRQTKYIFKEAVRSLIPSRIIDRPKRGFGLPIQRWLRGDLQRTAAEILLSDKCRQRGLFDCIAIEHVLRNPRALQRELALLLLSMMMIELWLQQFLD